MLTRILLEDLRVNCLIGCLAEERTRMQELGVEVDLWLDAEQAAIRDSLPHTWNYAALAAQVGFVLEHGRFYLLEAAARVLLRLLLLPPAPNEERPPVLRARVALTKFGVLPGVARPTVELLGENVDFATEDKPWGTVNVIAETRHMGLYRLNIGPGEELPNHFHHRMNEAEMALGDGLLSFRGEEPPRALAAGEVLRWRHKEAHGYRNAGPVVHSLLCLDRPPFDPEDEVAAPTFS